MLRTFHGFFWPSSSATSNSGDHKRWSLLGLSLLLGSQLLLGHPQTVWFSAVACVVYVGCRASEFARFSLLALLVVAAASGVMLGSTQLLPSLDLLEQSARGNPTRDFRLSLSLHPFNLAQLWSPYVFPNRTYGLPRENFVHEFGVYNGALCSLAVVWALIRRKRISHPRLAAFGALVGGVGLLLALGRYGGVYELLTALPLVGKFRGPTRHILLVHLGMAILTAVMVHDIVRGRDERSGREVRAVRWLGIPVMLSLGTLITSWFWPESFSWNAEQHDLWIPAAVSLAIVLTTTVLVSDAARGATIAMLALPICLSLDLGLWGYTYVFADKPRTVSDLATLRDAPPDVRPGTRVHLEPAEPMVNYLILRDLSVLQPYVGLKPVRRLPSWSSTNLRLAGAEWANLAHGWQRVPAPMSRARLVSNIHVSDNPERDIAEIDISVTALVERPVEVAGPVSASSVRIVTDDPGQIRIDIDAADQPLLVTTETFHTGWRATVGERTLETLRVNGDYLGVLLESGRYQTLSGLSARKRTEGNLADRRRGGAHPLARHSGGAPLER